LARDDQRTVGVREEQLFVALDGDRVVAVLFVQARELGEGLVATPLARIGQHQELEHLDAVVAVGPEPEAAVAARQRESGLQQDVARLRAPVVAWIVGLELLQDAVGLVRTSALDVQPRGRDAGRDRELLRQLEVGQILELLGIGVGARQLLDALRRIAFDRHVELVARLRVEAAHLARLCHALERRRRASGAEVALRRRDRTRDFVGPSSARSASCSRASSCRRTARRGARRRRNGGS
jgi:hypothetical protein